MPIVKSKQLACPDYGRMKINYQLDEPTFTSPGRKHDKKACSPSCGILKLSIHASWEKAFFTFESVRYSYEPPVRLR